MMVRREVAVKLYLAYIIYPISEDIPVQGRVTFLPVEINMNGAQLNKVHNTLIYLIFDNT